jgi:hypothetical protein
MILLKNILPWWMDLLKNILVTRGKYILEYPFLLMLTSSLPCSHVHKIIFMNLVSCLKCPHMDLEVGWSW